MNACSTSFYDAPECFFCVSNVSECRKRRWVGFKQFCSTGGCNVVWFDITKTFFGVRSSLEFEFHHAV